MKKIILLILLLSTLVSISSCGKKESQPGLKEAAQQTESKENKQDNSKTENRDLSEEQKEKLKEEQEKIQNATSAHDPDTKSRSVVLYFPDKNMQSLTTEKRSFNSDDDALEWALVNELIRGPEDPNHTKGIQGDVAILSLDIQDKLCTIDLSEEFITENTGGSAKETMAIYSIVNTLCQSDKIDKVKINVEGNTEAEFGEFLLDEPFEENKEIVSK